MIYMTMREFTKFAIAEHRRRDPQKRRTNCSICGCSGVVCQWAHILPLCKFAVYYAPRTIATISMCKDHHKLFDDVILLEMFKGANWRKSKRLRDEDSTPEQKAKIITMLEAVDYARQDIHGMTFFDYRIHTQPIGIIEK